jgi:hypothetical protein
MICKFVVVGTCFSDANFSFCCASAAKKSSVSIAVSLEDWLIFASLCQMENFQIENNTVRKILTEETSLEEESMRRLLSTSLGNTSFFLHSSNILRSDA